MNAEVGHTMNVDIARVSRKQNARERQEREREERDDHGYRHRDTDAARMGNKSQDKARP